MSSPLRDLMAENPWGSQRSSTTSKECERQKRYAVPANRIALHFERDGRYGKTQDHPAPSQQYGGLKSVTYLPDDAAALDYALSMVHQSREKSSQR